MKASLLACGLLGIMGYFYLKAVDNAVKDVTLIARGSSARMDETDRRLDSIEDRLSTLPALAQEISEIRRLLERKSGGSR